MHALPWENHSVDLVTSFRGIWGTTPDALAEAQRVLVPGARLGFTVWGRIKKSPGAWSLSPFQLASQPKVENQANMVALGRPGAGEELLSRYGFEDVSRMTVLFAWEFPGPETYARALASTGPTYEAIQTVARRSSSAGPPRWRASTSGTACRCGPRSTSWATSPALGAKRFGLHRRRLEVRRVPRARSCDSRCAGLRRLGAPGLPTPTPPRSRISTASGTRGTTTRRSSRSRCSSHSGSRSRP